MFLKTQTLDRVRQAPDLAAPKRPSAFLKLEFGGQIDERVRSRIDYTFRVFCGVFGYEPTTEANVADARLCYGVAPTQKTDIAILHQYRPDVATHNLSTSLNSLPIARWSLPCFFGAKDALADWLGEAFYWISGECERGIAERDTVNRIPYEATLHHRCGLDPTVPYAALAFRGLNDALATVLGASALNAPRKPWKGGGECIIAATHDVDFLPTTMLAAIKRSLKNAMIAGLLHGNFKLALSIVGTTVNKLARGERPLQMLPDLMRREAECDILSTYFVLCRQAHSRDANYSIDDESVQAVLRELTSQGFEIGIHGSYSSLERTGRLAEEYAKLAGLGWNATGSRQHWLRYQGSELFDALVRANARYDCSVGYPCHSGFRSGASFPYPPYNFETESAYPLIELPMVLMNNTVYHEFKDRQAAIEGCRALLDTVRELGWGGVSILWHDTGFGGEQFPRWSGDLYWELKGEDLWRSGEEVSRIAATRFAQVGL